MYVELGKVVKPHGFKGAFVASMHSGDQSAIGGLTEICLGKSADRLSEPHKVVEASWMPKGWKILLEGIDTEEKAEALRGLLLFAPREALPTLESGEYYLSDLENCRLVEEETGKEIGHWQGCETLPGGQERWWLKVGEEVIALPATNRFIHRVDVAARIIYLKNLGELK